MESTLDVGEQKFTKRKGTGGKMAWEKGSDNWAGGRGQVKIEGIDKGKKRLLYRHGDDSGDNHHLTGKLKNR